MSNDSMPFGVALALVIVGMFLGSIFSFGMQHWNKKVAQKDCIRIETQFWEYEDIRQSKRPATIKEIAIDCANGKRYFIDGVSINSELREKVSKLAFNEDITLFIHPNSNTIVELSTNSDTILPFTETIDKLGEEATGFLFLGLFMYFCSLVGLYYVVLHGAQKWKRKATR